MEVYGNLYPFYLGVVAIMIIVIIIANVVTILAFYKERILRQKTSNWFILNLSIADLGVGLRRLYRFPWKSMGQWPYGKSGCQLGSFLITAFVSTGLLTTAAISVDRFLLISREYPKYLKLTTKKRMAYTIGAIWFYGIVLASIELILWDSLTPPESHTSYFNYNQVCRSPPKHNMVFATVLLLVGFCGPLVAIELFSMRFLIVFIRKMRKDVNVHPSLTSRGQPRGQPGSSSASAPQSQGQGGSSSGQNNAFAPQPNEEASVPSSLRNSVPNKRYRKAAVLLGAIVLAVNICTMPWVMYVPIVKLFCPQCNNTFIREIFGELILLNSAINPFLYAVTMPKMRAFYKRVLSRCKPP